MKLLGACAGPPHLSGGPLGELGPQDLRCRSQQEMLKEEFEEQEERRVGVVTTATPVQRGPCPDGCDCRVGDGGTLTSPHLTSSHLISPHL